MYIERGQEACASHERGEEKRLKVCASRKRGGEEEREGRRRAHHIREEKTRGEEKGLKVCTSRKKKKREKAGACA